MTTTTPLQKQKMEMEMEICDERFPFYDPVDEYPLIDVSSFFAESPMLYLPEPELLLDSDDPLQDPFIWAVCNGTDEDDAKGDFSPSCFYDFPEEINGDQGIDGVSDVAGNHQAVPLAVFSEYDCSCCQRLRVITHTRGENVKRLEIHGSLGVITHAVLEIFDSDLGFGCKERQMFDFQTEAAENVKWFLDQYLESCKEEGYNMEKDPMSTFYEALSVGLKENESSDEFLQLPEENTGSCQINEHVDPRRLGCTKIPLATQRARTGRLKLKDLTEYFEFPIEVAARKMSLCPTVLKKICRRNGVHRWPYRKIRSYKSKIAKTAKLLESSNDDAERAQALLADIQIHQQGLVNIYEKFSQEIDEQ